MTNNRCFELLKNIMQTAFQTETIYFELPYGEVANVPTEIMKMIQPNVFSADSRLMLSSKTPDRRLFVVKTSLFFYTINFYLSLENPSDVIVIGPFRSEDISVEEFAEKINSIPFLKPKYRDLLNYYQMLPCVRLQSIVNTVSYIINSYALTPHTFVPVSVDFSIINEFDFEPEEGTVNINKQSVDKTADILYRLQESMKNGDVEAMQMAMKEFLAEHRILSQKNFTDSKRGLYMINQYFQINLLNTHIQKMDAAKLYATVIEKINKVNRQDELVKMAYEIGVSYCALFQNNKFPEYSKTISDVINYIHLHLQEPLSLSYLAEQFSKNDSTLSNSFKQSTGMTITNYIQQTRMNRAMDYLHTETMSISEIALATGYSDFNYFSKLFKKHTGYSPTEYRKIHIKD